MTSNNVTRFNNIAISLHWLMAFLIVAMLALGKFMVNLDQTDPLRFTLTQWHKTTGVLILLLAVGRLVWRVTHTSPPHPTGAPAWERLASSVSHVVLYALLFIAPITGWMMVSVSPLNIDTLLFNVVPWPHIPWLENIADKHTAESLYKSWHEIATGVLIALLLVHIAAALKHHLIDKDTVLTRMLPSREARTAKTFVHLILALVLGVGVTVFAYATLQYSAAANFSAGNSAVQATAMVSGDETQISFPESTVTATINPDDLANSALNATVHTGSVTSENAQVQGSLPDADWFNSESHPTAMFESSSMEMDDQGQILVRGTLTIKGIDQVQTFVMRIDDTQSNSTGKKSASGEFTVDRTDYQLGLESQPDPTWVGNEVIIRFEFELTE